MRISQKFPNEFTGDATLIYRDLPVGSLFCWTNSMTSRHGLQHVGYKAKNGFCFFTDDSPEFHVPDSFEQGDSVILLDHELIIKGEL